MPLIALIDACVLFSMPLRDTIFRAAIEGLFSMRLTDAILEETFRNLVEKRGISADAARRQRSMIRKKFDSSFVLLSDYGEIIDHMPINEKDRHVLAAAVCARAHIIVTQNLKHFPKRLLMPYGVQAQSVDNFLTDLFYVDPDTMTNILIAQSTNLHNPHLSASQILDYMAPQAPRFAQLAREELHLEPSPSWPVYIEATVNDAQGDL